MDIKNETTHTVTLYEGTIHGFGRVRSENETTYIVTCPYRVLIVVSAR